jgi:hypothetical protein
MKMFDDEDIAFKFLFLVLGLALSVLVLILAFNLFMAVFCTFFSECKFIK